jgi:hypothetical protein
MKKIFGIKDVMINRTLNLSINLGFRSSASLEKALLKVASKHSVNGKYLLQVFRYTLPTKRNGDKLMIKADFCMSYEAMNLLGINPQELIDDILVVCYAQKQFNAMIDSTNYITEEVLKDYWKTAEQSAKTIMSNNKAPYGEPISVIGVDLDDLPF